MPNNRKALMSGLWFTVSNFLIRSLGFITTPLFTRLMTKAEYGEYNNFTTWCGLLVIITSLNLDASFIRARYDFDEELDSYALSMIVLEALSTCIWYAIVKLFIGFFQNAFSMDIKYINAMFIYLMFIPIINIFQSCERFKYEYKKNVAISMSIAISTSALSVLLVYALDDHLLGRVIGYVLPIVIISLFIVIYYLGKTRSIKISFWKYALPFSLPFVPHLLSMILLGGMDKIMIRRLCNAEDLALYSLAYTVGTIISMLVSSINSAYSPWLGEQLNGHNYEAVRKVSTPYVAAFGVIGVVLALIGPEILLVLGGDSYSEAVNIIPPVTAGCIMQFIYSLYVNVEQYEKKTVGMAMASCIAACINFVLNYIFIRMFGYIAAAYTTFVGYLCLYIMHVWLVNRIGMGQVYNNRRMAFMALLLSACCFAALLLYNMTIVRYIAIAIVIAIVTSLLIKFRDKIKTLVFER